MAYQVLARKWRPQDFSEVIGQKAVVTALQNAVSAGRIAHAYLFSGIRGVGKTSVARILAKGLNCENGPAAEPCNDCGACREITAGADFDVIEHDAATYSKVEQVRELTESLKYGPARGRFKVVILDEIHRLSRQAFDALLKIVEEPPEHLVFIFATTEAEAVPATILSRCQEFRFKRVPIDELGAYLERVASKEGIEVGASAIRIIAKAGDGSVRDSVALLDQLATFGSGKIADGDAARLLGGLDQGVFREVLAAIGSGDRNAIATIASRIEEEGWDPRFVYSEFLSYCRMALHLCLDTDPERLETTREEAAALAELARSIGYQQILRALNLLLRSEESVRRGESAALALEVAWLRAAELPRLVAIEDFLAGVEPTDDGPTPPPTPEGKRKKKPRASAGKPVAKPAPEPPEAKASPAKQAAPEPPEPPGTDSASPEEPPREPVELLLATIGRKRQPLAAHLAGAHSLAFEDGLLRIAVSAGDDWLATRLESAPNRNALESAMRSVWGDGCRWKIFEEDAPAPAPEPEAEATEEALGDPRVQTVLEIFGGSVTSVEPLNET